MEGRNTRRRRRRLEIEPREKNNNILEHLPTAM